MLSPLLTKAVAEAVAIEAIRVAVIVLATTIVVGLLGHSLALVRGSCLSLIVAAGT